MERLRQSVSILAVLAASAALAAACDDDGGGEADAGSDGAVDAGGDGGGSHGDADASSADGGADGSDDAGDAGADGAGDAAADVGPPVDADASCAALCAPFSACSSVYGDAAACETACAAQYDLLSAFGRSCERALESFYACLQALDCAGHDAYYDREAAGYPCEGEEAALVEICFPGADETVRTSCRTGCAKSGACYPSVRNVGVGGCLNACAMELGRAADDGEACTTSLLAARACGHGLICSEYTAWLNEEGSSYPCQSENEAAAAACPSLAP